MKLNLNCIEWINVNKSAKLIKKKNSNISNPDSVYLLSLAVQNISLNNNNINNQQNYDYNIACLSSEQIIHIYDSQNLKLKSQIKNAHEISINEIGFFKQQLSFNEEQNQLFTCGDDGQLKCWDLRCENKPTICIDLNSDSRKLLCADVNATSRMIATGTDKNIDDALIYIYDIRFIKRYMFKLRESHSMDITQMKFHPYK